MTTTTEQPKGRTLTGTVVSDKMTKTVVVAVSRLKMHPMYRKQYRVTDRYQAHDEAGAYHAGDKVVIRETRPMSRHKRWVVESKVKSPKS